jgi:hypothetical protein
VVKSISPEVRASRARIFIPLFDAALFLLKKFCDIDILENVGVRRLKRSGEDRCAWRINSGCRQD